MRRFWLLAVLLVSLAPGLSAQQVLTATGSYTYYAPSNITLDQAKALALERAKIQIIADHFGTVVGVRNYTHIENESGESAVSFLSLGESEVKGEWIETIGKPSFEVRYEDHLQVVRATVRGKIRETVESTTPVIAKVLRNGISDKYESNVFKEGDGLYLSFKTPVDGFLAVFLYDGNGVNRLLPKKNEANGSYGVKAGTREVFFANHFSGVDNSGRYVDTLRSDYVMTCDADNELNRIYVVFSTNNFSRPYDELPEDEKAPAFLTFEAFQRWLSRSRLQDKAMTVAIRDILIRKKRETVAGAACSPVRVSCIERTGLSFAFRCFYAAVC